MQEEHVVFTDTPEQGFVTTIDYTDSFEHGPQARKITIEALGENHITSRQFHAVPPMRLIHQHKEKTNPGGPASWIGDDDPRNYLSNDFHVAPGIEREPIRLQAIKMVFERARAKGEPPAQAVAEGMGVSIATAGRWIRKSKNHLGWS